VTARPGAAKTRLSTQSATCADPAAEFLLVVVDAACIYWRVSAVPVAPPRFALKARQWETVLLEPQPWPAPA
jgi:hypothetical protein